MFVSWIDRSIVVRLYTKVSLPHKNTQTSESIKTVYIEKSTIEREKTPTNKLNHHMGIIRTINSKTTTIKTTKFGYKM